jgi:hypothetical protein
MKPIMLLALGLLIICIVAGGADRQPAAFAQSPAAGPAAPYAPAVAAATNDFRLHPLPPLFAVGRTVTHAGAQMTFRILAIHGEWIETDQGWIHVPSFWNQQQPFWR